MKLIEREPTEAMLAAFSTEFYRELKSFDVRNCWYVMYDAAPEQNAAATHSEVSERDREPSNQPDKVVRNDAIDRSEVVSSAALRIARETIERDDKDNAGSRILRPGLTDEYVLSKALIAAAMENGQAESQSPVIPDPAPLAAAPTDAEVRELVEALTRLEKHYDSEDCWYSCSTLTCNDQRRSLQCDCGADRINAMHERAATLLTAMLAEREANAKDAERYRWLRTNAATIMQNNGGEYDAFVEWLPEEIELSIPFQRRCTYPVQDRLTSSGPVVEHGRPGQVRKAVETLRSTQFAASFGFIAVACAHCLPRSAHCVVC